MAKIIYDQVADAARRIAESGDTPSAPKVRILLGDKGGMATIQKHLDVWRTTDEGARAGKPELPPMPETLQKDANTLIQQIWCHAKAEANADLKAEKEKLNQERNDIQLSLAETVAISEQQEQQIDELNNRAQQYEEQLKALQERNDKASAEINNHKTEQAVLRERCQQYEYSLSEAKEREGTLLKRLEKLSDSIERSKNKK